MSFLCRTVAILRGVQILYWATVIAFTAADNQGGVVTVFAPHDGENTRIAVSAAIPIFARRGQRKYSNYVRVFSLVRKYSN